MRNVCVPGKSTRVKRFAASFPSKIAIHRKALEGKTPRKAYCRKNVSRPIVLFEKALLSKASPLARISAAQGGKFRRDSLDFCFPEPSFASMPLKVSSSALSEVKAEFRGFDRIMIAAPAALLSFASGPAQLHPEATFFWGRIPHCSTREAGPLHDAKAENCCFIFLIEIVDSALRLKEQRTRPQFIRSPRASRD